MRQPDSPVGGTLGGMSRVHVLSTADLSAEWRGRLRALLDDAFDGDFSDDDWEHALGGWHVVVTDGPLPVAHAAVVPRAIDVGARTFRAGYVEAVGTAPAAQGAGHGSRAMAEATRLVQRDHELGVLGTGRHAFYERLGWERWRGAAFVLRDGERVRTPGEEDGLMVLRFGPSAGVALTDPIACRPRRGDDW